MVSRRHLERAKIRVAAIYAVGDVFPAALAARRPDCVMLDIHTRGLSGGDVLARVKATHADLRVAFITASDNPDLGRHEP